MADVPTIGRIIQFPAAGDAPGVTGVSGVNASSLTLASSQSATNPMRLTPGELKQCPDDRSFTI